MESKLLIQLAGAPSPASTELPCQSHAEIKLAHFPSSLRWLETEFSKTSSLPLQVTSSCCHRQPRGYFWKVFASRNLILEARELRCSHFVYISMQRCFSQL